MGNRAVRFDQSEPANTQPMASHDIVDQIRAEARKQTTLGQAFDMLRVADEIERLRVAGDALVAAIRNHDLTEKHIKAWQEARRG